MTRPYRKKLVAPFSTVTDLSDLPQWDMNFHRRIARIGETLDFLPQFLKCEIYG